MRKLFKPFLCCLLTIALVFSDISILAYAKESTESVESSEIVTEAEETTKDPEIIYEMTDKRDEATKYFAMSDGTTKAMIYPQNVHYLTDGKYEEIDNTLVETKENGKTYYKNKKNDFSVKLPESFTDDYIEFTDDNGYVRFKLKGATNKKIEKQEKEKNTKKKKDITVLENVNDRAIYKSVKGNVDVEYDIEGNKLKETIALYKKTKNAFIFDVQTSAASVKLNKDNSISFYDKNDEELYIMASPYMADAAGEYSNDIQVKIIKSDEGYTLTYQPDYDWLSSKDREYPVRIDPTLFKAVDRNTVTDTYVTNVQSASDAQSYGKTDVINIGRRATNIGGGSQLTMRGFIRFDVPSEIGKHDCILDARLYLTHYNDSSYVSVNGTQIDVHELKTAFSESTTWWGNQPSYDPIITDYTIVNTNNIFTGTSFSYDSYNLTKLVNKWHNGGTNYGIALKLHDEGTTVSSSKQVYYLAKQSKFFGSVSKFVEITYRNATGLEDYWSYTTQDFGQYGTGYVNNYNGNLVYVHEDTSFNSLINGFTLSHVYNTNLAGTGMGYYGSGWRLNLVQKLEPITVTGNSSVKYVYTDGDGTRHYFVQNSDGKIVDEDGLGYTYEDISEGELTRKFTDKNGTVYKFDMWSFLRRIVDSNGNTIQLNYSPGTTSSLNYLTSITTSSGCKIVLTYSSNKLISITDNCGRITSFEYHSENLSKIDYPDGTDLKFEYNGSNHWLQKVISPDDAKIYYENQSSNGKISATRMYGTDGTASASSTFQYSQNQTRVVDSQSRGITYQFDTWGRVTCVYDDKQNIYSQTYNPTVTIGSGIFNNNKLKASPCEAVYVNNLLTNGVFANGLTGWTQYKENPNSQISEVTGEGLFTSKLIKITSEGNTIEVIAQSPSLSSERTYTFSGYLKTENVQSDTLGAGLEVVVIGGTKAKHYLSESIRGTTDNKSNNGYQHVSVTVTLEEGEFITRVTAGLYNASGTVYIDALQLEEGDTANQINLVDNSSFEYSSGMENTPSKYSKNYTDNYSGMATNEKKSGNSSYKVDGIASQTRYLVQNINIDGKAGDIYSYGGWGKGDSVSQEDYTNFYIVFQFLYNDNTSGWFDCHFNEYVVDWQFAMKTIIAQKDFHAIGIYCCYYKNVNSAYFDDLFVYRDTMQSYVYDGDGNVISTIDYASQNNSFQYNSNNYLSKLINPTGNSYEYLYDSKNNMTFARSGEGMAYGVEYDSQGNVTSTHTKNHPYSSSIQAGKTYYIRLKGDGKYLTVADARSENLTNVIEDTFTGGEHQQWVLESNGNGYYIISPKHATDKALDVSKAENIEDTNVQIYQKNNATAQNFKIIPQSDYSYTITPQCSWDGKILTVNHAVTTNNVTILSAQGSNNPDQEWYFEDAEQPHESIIEDGAIYQFRAWHSGKYLDVYCAQTTVGTYLQQYEQNLEECQRFRVQKYGETDYFTLTPVHAPERLIEVSTGVLTYGANSYNYLQIGNDTITERKLFKIEYNADRKAFQIIPKHDETLALDVAEYSVYNCARLIFTQKNNNTNRFFIAEKFSDTITSSATYQDNGNYPHTTTDARGNTTTYTYDTSRGLQTGVTDAKGNTTTYAYNALNDRLESVNAGNSTVNYQYETNGALKKITTANGTIYNFIYDVFGRTSRISVGNQLLSETIYKDNNSTLVGEFKYGNNVSKTYTYDDQDRLISESINGTLTRTYVYDKSGNIARVTDHTTNITTTFRYDLIGRTVEIKTSDGQSMNFNYDKFNRLSLSKWLIGNTALSTGYIYGDNAISGQKAGLIYGVKLNGVQQLAYQYDELARLKTRTLNTTNPFVTEYGYLEGSAANTTTTLVKTVRNGNDTLEYTYDELGNITSVSKNNTIIEQYTYDALNQLTSATYGGNTYTYTYDNGGNLTEIKKNGTVIKSYTYGNSNWKDQLTAFNGQTISYDKIGNPLTYRSGMNFTWQNGRQLATITQNGNAVATYAYDADGIRTSKTVNGTTTEYYWQNGVLYGQKNGNEYIFFLYDENGIAYGFIIQNGEVKSHYYYEFNLQSDIIGIIDSTGTKIVEYTYGAWGDIISITGTHADTIGQKNPLRYRGYYYDAETGFYATGTRYYDPEIGRFINADNQLSTGDMTGMNLFAYCGNNAVNRIDPTGEAWWHWALGATVVAACAVATVVTCGGFAAAATAVCMVGSGFAASTTASTIAAGAFISSATVYGMAALSAASASNSIQEFNNHGNWGTVAVTAGGALLGGYDGYTMSKSQTPTTTTTGKGTQNPKVKAAIQKGQAMHKQMNYGPGVLKEQTIAPGCRVDGIDFNNRIIYELKPNNPQAIARGMSQLNRYTTVASQQFGGVWTGVLKLYD